ncbi:MAG: XTP/dITP diphosphatase [Clostridiales bacterium]|nr:XTP/dITP diphosphatase [Clostridiales bacterium]
MDNILVVATRNEGKLKELKGIAEKYGMQLLSMKDVGYGDFEIEENGESFRENALIKAETLCEMLGRPCIGDDSGLCVDALGGAPGVHSARYAGEHGNDAANRTKLLEEMRGISERGAHFECCIALCFPKSKTIVARGICSGTIAEEERGSGGFGYDSLFVPEGYSETFAELPEEIKNLISHRGRALQELEKLLE